MVQKPHPGVTVTEYVRPNRQATLEVLDLNGKSATDDIFVYFDVPKGGVAEAVDNTMPLYGETLSDLVVAFQPGGLVFLKAASLRVQMGTDLVDIDLAELQVYHEYSDGTVEESTITSVQTYNNYLEFAAVVTGFSRYGLGGGFKPIAPNNKSILQPPQNSRYSPGGGF